MNTKLTRRYNMRKMASVVTVKSKSPIKDKDRIEYVSFNENAYSVICGKGLKIGQKVIYFEVDSILPEREEFEFLRKRCYNEKVKGFRIKAMKMSGLYSFGLVLPFEEFKLNPDEYKSGDDLTELLNVKKFEDFYDRTPREHEKPSRIKCILFKYARPVAKIIYGKTEPEPFPVHLIPKSDEENLFNHPEWFDAFHEQESYITAKMEGKSVTTYFEPHLFRCKYKVFGRNVELIDEDEIIWFKNNIAPKIRGTNVLLQGEFCSPKIQNGIYKNGTHYYVYNAKDFKTGLYLTKAELFDFCTEHDLETVPEILVYLKDFKSADDLYKFTDHLYFTEGTANVLVEAQKSKNSKNHEGIVVRSIDLNKNPWSFKVKSREYQCK